MDIKDDNYTPLVSAFTRLMDEDDEKDTTYQYQMLNKDNREFRLLELLPLPEPSASPLKCRMKHTSTSRVGELEYEAISYFWGNPSPSSMVIVDGKKLHLPVNSEQALRRMALPDGSRIVFLDAVCINQHDLVERASQVLLMGDVYRNAKATLVYLGDEVDSTAEAFENLRLLNLEFCEDLLDKGGYEQVMRTAVRMRLRPRSETALNEAALIELFGRPWFRRVWVVQEIALATKSRLICGAEEMDMSIVVEISRWLSLNHHIPFSLGEAILPVASFWSASHLLTHHRGTRITAILRNAELWQATDPRDKVFGMLGLLEKKDAESKLLAPDYTKPVFHVFRDAVKYCIANASQRPLRILNDISHRGDRKFLDCEFPSWVPRLDRVYDSDYDPGRLHTRNEHSTFGDWKYVSTTVNLLSDEPDILILSGMGMCTISGVSHTYIPPARFQGATQYCTASYRVKDLPKIFQSRGLSPAAVARTLVADDHRILSEKYKDHLDGLGKFMHHFGDPSVITPDEIEKTHARSPVRHAQYYSTAMARVSIHRRYAIMSNGTIGLVPQLTEPSDVVVMMHGGQFPFVLRPCGGDGGSGEDFFFLGTCYVDGWMAEQEHAEELHHLMLDTKPVTYRLR